MLSRNDLSRFLLAQSQLTYIRTLKQISAIRLALNTLPPDLPRIYKGVLDRLQEGDLEIAINALTWLLCCRRPMKLEELAVAAVIKTTPEIFNEEDKLLEDQMILRICGSSLVKINFQNSDVAFPHQSVVEFLSSPTLPDRKPNPYFIDHAIGSSACKSMHDLLSLSVQCKRTRAQFVSLLCYRGMVPLCKNSSRRPCYCGDDHIVL